MLRIDLLAMVICFESTKLQKGDSSMISTTTIRKDKSDLLVRRKGLAQPAAGLLGFFSLCASVAGQCDPGKIFPDSTYDVGISPGSIAIGDYDGDGVPDLAVSNSSSDSVSVLLGRGDGSFDFDVRFDVGDRPSYVVIDDLDGDTVPDLVTANSNSNDVSVLLGIGDGTFATQVTYGVGLDHRPRRI